MLSVRIISVDHYMSAPIHELDVSYSDFRGSPVKNVPVIRIFGTSEKGIKTCVHVHGVFPYICIPYDGTDNHNKLSYQLALSLDKAINIAQGYSGSNTQHVYKVILVSGIPFYGFHRKKHQFFKIYFYKPSVVKQAVTLLQSGAILNKVLQPHEAHIPFILQFFIDFNLYGMSFIKFQEVKFRETEYLATLSEKQLISAPAMSVCSLEADALASNILNRCANEGGGRISNPGLASIWEDERKRRSASSGTPIDTPPLHSQRPPLTPTASDLYFQMRVFEALEAYSESGDESTLSERTVSSSMIVYPAEEPPNSNNVDSSFVTLHLSQPTVPNHQINEVDDAVVDEDVAVSLLLSQKCVPETLNHSNAVNSDDIELLNLLEGLADTESSMVESNSILGSQKSLTNRSQIAQPVPSVPDEEPNDIDEEDSHWMDKTLSAEDEMKRLLDLTMPEVNNLDFSQMALNASEPQPGPSGLNFRNNIRMTQGKNSQSSTESEDSERIPQVDGADDIPGKPVRKSLGVRGRKRVSKVRKKNLMPSCTENKGNEDPAIDSSVSAISSTSPLPVFHPCPEDSENNPVSCAGPSFQEGLETCKIGSESPAIHFIQNDEKVILFSKDICQEECCQGLMNAKDSSKISSKAIVEDTATNAKQFFETFGVAGSFKECHETAVALNDAPQPSSDSVLNPDMFEQNFINQDVDENSVLRGDPSLYPDTSCEPEWLADLISEEVRRVNSDGGGLVDSCTVSPLSSECPAPLDTLNKSSNIRRSTRLALKSNNIIETETAACQSVNLLVDDLDISSSWSPCSCNDITGIPGFSPNVYLDIRESLGSLYTSNVDGTLIDTEMRRISGALRDGHMDVILQSGNTDSDNPPASSRREELINAVQSLECQGTCSKAKRKSKQPQADVSDPVTDEHLHRGRKPLPGPPPPPPGLNRGKDMLLFAKYYKNKTLKTFNNFKTEDSSLDSTVLSKRISTKEIRKRRKLKLSLSYREKNQHNQCKDSSHKKRKSSSLKGTQQSSFTNQVTSPSQIKDCCVILEKLTPANISKVCRKQKIKLCDKSYFKSPAVKIKVNTAIGYSSAQGEFLKPSSYKIPKKQSTVKKRSRTWDGADTSQAKKRAPAAHLRTAAKDIGDKPDCLKLRDSSSSKFTSGENSHNSHISQEISVCQNLNEAPKNEDSGVDTNGEGTSPHTVTYEDITKENTPTDDISAVITLNASNDLHSSVMDAVDSLCGSIDIQTGNQLFGSLDVNIGGMFNFQSHELSKKQIIFTDGASAEGSSSESSGKSNPETHVPHHVDCSEEQLCVPVRESHWFSQQYQPWISLWSPTSSPTQSLQLFSPPLPDSPGLVPCPSQGSAEPSCIDSSGSDASSDIDCIGPTPPSKNESSSSPQICKTDSSLTLKRTQQGKTFLFHNLIENSSKSAPSCQELFPLDYYNENSSCSDIFNAEESNQSFENFAKLGLSPSHPFSDLKDMEEEKCIQEKTRLKLSTSDLHNETLSPENKSSSVRQISQSSLASSESFDLPCGQRLKQNDLPENSSTFLPKLFLFTPVVKPPTPQQVLNSLVTLNIPEVINRDPYFSVHTDVKGKVEVGGNVLSLTSYKTIHLDEFKSGLQDLIGLREQQQRLFKQVWGLSQVQGDLNKLLMNSSCRDVCIAPVRKPPTVHEVLLWEKASRILQERAVQNRQKAECEFYKEIVTLGSPSSASQANRSIGTPALSPVVGLGVNSSTPNILCASLENKSSTLSSPMFTPISESNLLLKRRCARSRRSISKQFDVSQNHSRLPVITEKGESNDTSLPSEALSSSEQVENQETSCVEVDASLQCLLTDTQFQKQALSPIMRCAPDASACIIKGPSKSSPGFKLVLENLKDTRLDIEHQFTTIMCLELHICTCGALSPNPERDPIRAVFYNIVNDVPKSSALPPSISGIIAVNDFKSGDSFLNKSGINCNAKYVSDEKALILDTVALVRQWDPDIFVGYEIEMLSWGYLIQRAYTLGHNISQNLSRVPQQKALASDDDFDDNNGLCGPKLPGRILLDLWRLLRSELTLQSYTFENVMYHVLHQRVSHHAFEVLSKWWEHPSCLLRWMTVEYYQLRVSGVVRILEQLDLIGRTSELARLFGIQFFEVLSRGSQFRVESMMLRLAKPQNFVPLSPSVQQRAHMRAPESVPLIMEPESRFYSDPVIVLDFQSLYPSIIIAYNYCFSTCLGREEFLGKSSSFEFGCSNLRISSRYLKSIKDNFTCSPCGVAFVSSNIRRGILPIMLEEILEARLAVKQSMKQHKSNHALQRVLHSRQLGLKLIANVTYGYTSANFSGRMPCIEVGDSVVSKGRETLERAIALVNSHQNWRARVVYGDTDSLFVLVPGRNRKEAFRIGAEIAEAVTQDNPSPVKLKLEKVYQPSILQTKKRYVGYMYESPDQKDPVYEAKGIETVRRDGCPAVAKILEQSLRILFEKYDVSLVKRYVCHQFSKLLAGRANIQDLIFAREYRGMASYRPGACVPALELTKKWIKTDKRAEPRVGERVPYVVINGPPGQALIHLVRHPHELLSDHSLRYNAVYYITRAIIPPLARCFSLLGADVLSWFSDIPRQHQSILPSTVPSGTKKTISQYFSTLECACCGAQSHGGVCEMCNSKPQILAATLMDKAHRSEASYLSISKVCQSCLGRSGFLDCNSLDCPINYRRHQAFQQLQKSSYYYQLLEGCLHSDDC